MPFFGTSSFVRCKRAMSSRSVGFPPPHSESGRSSSRRFNVSRSTSRTKTPSNKSINFAKFLEPPQKNVTASSRLATRAFTLSTCQIETCLSAWRSARLCRRTRSTPSRRWWRSFSGWPLRPWRCPTAPSSRSSSPTRPVRPNRLRVSGRRWPEERVHRQGAQPGRRQDDPVPPDPRNRRQPHRPALEYRFRGSDAHPQ